MTIEDLRDIKVDAVARDRNLLLRRFTGLLKQLGIYEEDSLIDRYEDDDYLITPVNICLFGESEGRERYRLDVNVRSSWCKYATLGYGSTYRIWRLLRFTAILDNEGIVENIDIAKESIGSSFYQIDLDVEKFEGSKVVRNKIRSLLGLLGRGFPGRTKERLKLGRGK